MTHGSVRALIVAALLTLAACGGDIAPPYAECGGSDDCAAPSDACYRLRFSRSDGTMADGKFCSAVCTSDAMCPDEGVCLALAGDASGQTICYAPCTSAAACYAGLRCTSVRGASVASVCMP